MRRLTLAISQQVQSLTIFVLGRPPYCCDMCFQRGESQKWSEPHENKQLLLITKLNDTPQGNTLTFQKKKMQGD